MWSSQIALIIREMAFECMLPNASPSLLSLKSAFLSSLLVRSKHHLTLLREFTSSEFHLLLHFYTFCSLHNENVSREGFWSFFSPWGCNGNTILKGAEFTQNKDNSLSVILLVICTDIAIASKCIHGLMISMSVSFFLLRRQVLIVGHEPT